jgi:hypothetical protein
VIVFLKKSLQRPLIFAIIPTDENFGGSTVDLIDAYLRIHTGDYCTSPLASLLFLSFLPFQTISRFHDLIYFAFSLSGFAPILYHIVYLSMVLPSVSSGGARLTSPLSVSPPASRSFTICSCGWSLAL